MAMGLASCSKIRPPMFARSSRYSDWTTTSGSTATVRRTGASRQNKPAPSKLRACLDRQWRVRQARSDSVPGFWEFQREPNRLSVTRYALDAPIVGHRCDDADSSAVGGRRRHIEVDRRVSAAVPDFESDLGTLAIERQRDVSACVDHRVGDQLADEERGHLFQVADAPFVQGVGNKPSSDRNFFAFGTEREMRVDVGSLPDSTPNQPGLTTSLRPRMGVGGS